MITLRDAAKLLDILVTMPDRPLDPVLKCAISLGAQSLRRIAFERTRNYPNAAKLLPTEITGSAWSPTDAFPDSDARASRSKL